MAYARAMDIQRLSMDMATQRVQDQVGAKVMSMALGAVKEQSASVAAMMESVQPPRATDPSLGSVVDLLA